MLYLEDYLEMIEHLPQELRDRLTEMREMDLQVQNSADNLEKRVRTFFGNAKKMKVQEKEAEYESIRKDYYKTLEDADEKVQLANQMSDLVTRYLRRLEQETHNFKLELEADHMGITEILEKRSQELDAPPTPNSGNSSQKENRYSINSSRTAHQEKRRDSTSSNEHSGSNKRLATVTDMRLGAGAAAAGAVGVGPVLLAGAQPTAASASSVPPAVNYTLGHISAGGTAIAAAASQAIAATQQMQQGRRTASLKASYEAIHSAASSNGGGGGSGGGGGGGSASGSGHGAVGHVPHEISISKEIAGAAQTAIAAIQDTHKKHKKKNSMLASGGGGGGSSPVVASPAMASLQLQQPLSPTDSAAEKNSEVYDPNEPRYCLCNEVAFGGMVACDNKKCPYEWYHYPCVGITEAPKGKWYCHLCSNSSTMKKRGARKTMSQC